MGEPIVRKKQPVFGLAEKAQLKMHSVNLTRAQNFGLQEKNATLKMTAAIHRAVESLFEKLELEKDTSLERLVDRLPINVSDSVADYLMVEADPLAKSAATLPYYYALDLLCGLFRSKVIEATQPKLGAQATNYRDSAFNLINHHLSQTTKDGRVFRSVGGAETVAPKSESKSDTRSSSDDLKRVESNMEQLGYAITPYGLAVGLLSLESNYSPAEVASHLGLATLALDAKEAEMDITKLIALLPHARAMVEILSEFKESGLMREEIYKNNSHAILKVVIPDKNQPIWIERVLSDPMVAKDRVAISNINYNNCF